MTRKSVKEYKELAVNLTGMLGDAKNLLLRYKKFPQLFNEEIIKTLEKQIDWLVWNSNIARPLELRAAQFIAQNNVHTWDDVMDNLWNITSLPQGDEDIYLKGPR